MQFEQDSQMAKRGMEIYQQQLKAKLEKDHKDEIVAIEVESGDYFLGKTIIEAADKGKKKYPGKGFYFIRIGHKAVHFVGGNE
jgi:hypothetical protein